MNQHSEPIFSCFGFKIDWGINQASFLNRDTETTAIKEIDGMPGVKWSLKCETYGRSGDRYDNNMYAKFHLIVNSSVEVNFKVDFEVNYGKNKYTITSNSTRNKTCDLSRIDVEDLFKPSNYYFSCGKLTANIHGSFWYDKKKTVCPIMNNPTEWKSRLIQKIPQDFEIIIDSESIKIIKLFITAESDVFEKMFEADFTEAKDNKATIQGYKFETVKSALDYCYGQNISDFINDRENAIELLLFANQYNFCTLKPKMEKHFAEMLAPDNVELFASVSEKANALVLRQSCVNFVQSLFNTSPEWPNGKLPEFDPQFMKEVVAQALMKKL